MPKNEAGKICCEFCGKEIDLIMVGAYNLSLLRGYGRNPDGSNKWACAPCYKKKFHF